MKYLVPITLSAARLAAHCRPIDGCLQGATRCFSSAAQICNAHGRYQPLANCDLVSKHSGAPFVCSWVNEQVDDDPIAGHTCVPAQGDSTPAGER